MAESCQATTRLVMRLQAAGAAGLSAPVARLPGRRGHPAGAMARLAAAVGRLGQATTRPVMAARFRLPERRHKGLAQVSTGSGEARDTRAIQPGQPVGHRARGWFRQGKKGESYRRGAGSAVTNNPAPALDRNGRDGTMRTRVPYDPRMVSRLTCLKRLPTGTTSNARPDPVAFAGATQQRGRLMSRAMPAPRRPRPAPMRVVPGQGHIMSVPPVAGRRQAPYRPGLLHHGPNSHSTRRSVLPAGMRGSRNILPPRVQPRTQARPAFISPAPMVRARTPGSADQAMAGAPIVQVTIPVTLDQHNVGQAFARIETSRALIEHRATGTAPDGIQHVQLPGRSVGI
ncbi:hypothetical protein [Komagataeibacter xylinus]|nr:hypothetical protein [Komagataeibacter xylinus]AZV37889.1 hypothetical protein CXP35_02750 [Komagataeibacter xylinus]